ncbi:MAG: radical SAM protein [Elusimicrobia bacterium]|nr:radical SAM protein [Elusimicrobiota bacterium]
MSPESSRLVFKQLDEWVGAGLKALEGCCDPEPIRELHLEITHRCDLKCVMCHHWEMPSRDPGSLARQLNPAEIEAFISRSELLRGVRTVVVTGGEPWTRPDAPQIVALLRRLYPEASLGVLTNFWNAELLRRKLLEAEALGASGIWLGSSLDGLEETHDLVRGQKGAFHGFRRSLEMLRREFPNIRASVNFTITPRNHRDLWAVYRFAQEEGLGFGCQFVVNHEGYQAPERFQWQSAELDEVESQIDRVLADIAARHGALERWLTRPAPESHGLWIQLLYWRYLRRHGRGSPRFFDDCMAGRRYAMLDPEGNLFFCPVNKNKHVGNVRNAPFDRIWSSARAEALRGELRPCQCRCWLNCIANPVLDRVLRAAWSDISPAPAHS